MSAKAASLVKSLDTAYFAIVDEWVEVTDESGVTQMKLKQPVFREQVFCINEAGHIDPKTGIKIPPKVKKLVPNRFNGVYEGIDCNRNLEDAERCIDVMLRRVDDKSNPIVGPFDTFEKAVTAVAALRKPTPTQLNQTLVVENKAKSEELDQLKARIAEMEKKGGATKPNP